MPLVLRQDVVDEFAAHHQGSAYVAGPDGRREQRLLAGPLTLRIGDRSTTRTASSDRLQAKRWSAMWSWPCWT